MRFYDVQFKTIIRNCSKIYCIYDKIELCEKNKERV